MKKYLLCLTMIAAVSAANGQTPKPTVAKPTTPRVVESPEHKAYRLSYESQLSKCEELLAQAEAIIDKGTSTHSDVVCVPNSNTPDKVVTNGLENQLAQVNASGIIDNRCGGCSSVAELKVALDILKSISSDPPGELYKELDNMRTQLTRVDTCVAVYHRTIDKKASDLTIRETEQVKACQSIDFYPPDK